LAANRLAKQESRETSEAGTIGCGREAYAQARKPAKLARVHARS
jgi:hypothetical protein